MRTIEWDSPSAAVRMIDQRGLPGRFSQVTCFQYHEIITAIQNMTIRGAPAIGVAGAMGIALAAAHHQASTIEELQTVLRKIGEEIAQARPTAVNLRWAVKRIMGVVEQSYPNLPGLREAVISEAQRMADEDVDANRRMAGFGAELLKDGDVIIHHCNTGSLAAVDWGTALGAIRLAHEQGKNLHVLVDETRPRLQGSRLTAWELEQYHIPYEIITDNMAGHFLYTGLANKVMFGADRIAANGDVANKIGTYMLALAANENQKTVLCVAPFSSIDLNTQNGDQIPIEERDPREVLGLSFEGEPVCPADATARNPAFDITPYKLISAIVTDRGVAYPPFENSLSNLSKSL
ncbi:MAG TPA: S-methyl-5-thioribose-1-phosphate isomerase [Longilinea sp.]|nr:S-methyl-5-thioribose-1-phosphate isomerase [Longilinea sp.]